MIADLRARPPVALLDRDDRDAESPPAGSLRITVSYVCELTAAARGIAKAAYEREVEVLGPALLRDGAGVDDG